MNDQRIMATVISLMGMDFMNKDFTGYEVTGHKFEIYGRCPKCAK